MIHYKNCAKVEEEAYSCLKVETDKEKEEEEKEEDIRRSDVAVNLEALPGKGVEAGGYSALGNSSARCDHKATAVLVDAFELLDFLGN